MAGSNARTYELSGPGTFISGLNWDSNLNRRLISVTEIDTITGGNNNTTGCYYFDTLISIYKGSALSGQGISKYAWLYDYTKDCILYGCSIEFSVDGSEGYWTSDHGSRDVYAVEKMGRLGYPSAGSYQNGGVRPVIEVDKNIIN